MKKFIKDTYACIPDRGLHGAVNRFQYFMNRKYKTNPNFYIMKFDISKFFYSIDKKILYEIVSKSIKDKMFLNCTKKLIFDGTAKGIPIGNYTSQFFANIYLNELDHYMKDELGIKEYIRYMDDFIVLTNSKEEAVELKEKVSIFLKERLDLKLNKKTNYFKAKQGVAFVRIPYLRKQN